MYEERLTVISKTCPCGKSFARAVSIDCIFGMTDYDYTVIDCPECKEKYDFIVIQDKHFNTDFQFQQKSKDKQKEEITETTSEQMNKVQK